MADTPSVDQKHRGAGLAEAPRTIPDYISGKPVRATREEVEAVQPFARRLVEDFGYRREQIQTHPQYRVRRSPSDEARSYPVDIAVFRSTDRAERDLLIVVECKKTTVRTGRRQLELYLDMCAAEVGVWFNGRVHLYLHRTVGEQGQIAYAALPNIPRRGQRVEDVGLYLRRDLVPPSNLKAVFRDVRNHLAGMTTGITRDEALAQEIINLLFCKLLDESDTAPGDPVTFRAGTGEAAATHRHTLCPGQGGGVRGCLPDGGPHSPGPRQRTVRGRGVADLLPHGGRPGRHRRRIRGLHRSRIARGRGTVLHAAQCRGTDCAHG